MSNLIKFLVVVVVSAVITSVSVLFLAPQVGAVLSANRAGEITAIDLSASPLAQRSVVLAADGSVMAQLHGGENRKSVALTDIPPVVVETILAVEDEHFFKHGGVNARATVRALLTNVADGAVRQGGSTITQQLVKNTTRDDEQELDRKVREAVLAVRLEEQYSKKEILERYLNTVYLGDQVYGVQAAAELYFGMDAEDMTRAEAVFLAGLIQSPSAYNPYTKPEAARERRDEVIDRLLAVDKITEDEATMLKASPIPTVKHEPKSAKDYFVDEVVQRLLVDERIGGRNREERKEILFEGGLTIRTTLDPKLQAGATMAMAAELPASDFTGAVVSIEPSTGAVRSMVGGAGFEKSKYNIVTMGWPGRQSGSSFKPFVLAAHLESGGSAADSISGVRPCPIPQPGKEPWSPANYGDSTGGSGDMRYVTLRSNNCAFAKLGHIVGIPRVLEVAKKMGVSEVHFQSPNPPSAALGSGGVSPLDMATAYATFANGGTYNEPYFVEEVIDRDGKVLFKHELDPRRAISEATAATVTDILEDNVSLQQGAGTGRRAQIGRPAAGKTGTTNDSVDAWFVGYVPQLATAVWMGHPNGSVPMMGLPMSPRGVTGGSYPAQIWGKYMSFAMRDQPVEQFPAMPPPPPGKFLLLPHEAAARERAMAEQNRRQEFRRQRESFFDRQRRDEPPPPDPSPQTTVLPLPNPERGGPNRFGFGD